MLRGCARPHLGKAARGVTPRLLLHLRPRRSSLGPQLPLPDSVRPKGQQHTASGFQEGVDARENVSMPTNLPGKKGDRQQNAQGQQDGFRLGNAFRAAMMV